jgi:hypothetical protein
MEMSPVGTTEKVIGLGIFNRKIFWREVRWGNSSGPYGTFCPSNFYPGLRPGLSSAVPAGLILQLLLTDHLGPQGGASFRSPAILRAQNAMHIKGRRSHIRLAEHHMHLAPMVRLVIEEMKDSVRRGILAILAQAISVTE